MSKKSTSATQDLFTVVKRNGAIVPFREERIVRAIELAFRETKKTEERHPEVERVALQVVQNLMAVANQGVSLTVEGIQDMVEVTLMKMGFHDVARDYIIYRDSHKQLRDDAPQNLKIQRKDGTRVRFNPIKLASSIEAAFRRAEKLEVGAVNTLTQKMVDRVIEDISCYQELTRQ